MLDDSDVQHVEGVGEAVEHKDCESSGALGALDAQDKVDAGDARAEEAAEEPQTRQRGTQ